MGVMSYSTLPVLLLILTLFKPSIISAFNTSSQSEAIHIMILYSTEGNWANISDYRTLIPQWKKHLRNKLKTDLTWPFSVVIESWDVQSNITFIEEIMQNRLSDTMLPGITAIIGEGDDGHPGSMMTKVAAQFGIPCIMTSLQPNYHSDDYKLPAEQNTSFLMIGSTVRVFEQAIETYLKQGVQTVVAVANIRKGMYNKRSCFDTADIMVRRGVTLLGKFSIEISDARNRVVEIIDAVKILDPDLILWCDWAACAITNNIEQYLPLKFFKAVNYLPKALTMLDCLGIFQAENDEERKMFQFVSGPTFYNVKIRGFDYVEDSTPYSSLFRPVTPIPFTGRYVYLYLCMIDAYVYIFYIF